MSFPGASSLRGVTWRNSTTHTRRTHTTPPPLQPLIGDVGSIRDYNQLSSLPDIVNRIEKETPAIVVGTYRPSLIRSAILIAAKDLTSDAMAMRGVWDGRLVVAHRDNSGAILLHVLPWIDQVIAERGNVAALEDLSSGGDLSPVIEILDWSFVEFKEGITEPQHDLLRYNDYDIELAWRTIANRLDAKK